MQCGNRIPLKNSIRDCQSIGLEDNQPFPAIVEVYVNSFRCESSKNRTTIHR